MLRWLLTRVWRAGQAFWQSRVSDVAGGGAPLPPGIPPEAKAMRHHNARCGGETPRAEVTAPPLRGSLRDRLQRERR